jgi:hypothetical protein
MELSENERLMLVRKKEEISKLTSELVESNLNNKQTIAKINEVISLLSTIGSYAKADRDLTAFTRLALQITTRIESGMNANLLIDAFCTAANSVKFDFTKRGLKLSFPIHINEAILNKFQLGGNL